MSLGVLGGTFNPIHVAHLRLGEAAREILGLERVLFVPAGDPPLKAAGVAPAVHRLEMVKLATADNPGFEVCDLEVSREGPSYTVDTLDALHRLRPQEELWFVIGADAFADFESWHRAADLFARASFGVVGRSGFADDPADLLPPALSGELHSGPRGLVHASGPEVRSIAFAPLGISSSDVRRRIARGGSVRYLVPDDVIEYIHKHQLYRGVDIPQEDA